MNDCELWWYPHSLDFISILTWNGWYSCLYTFSPGRGREGESDYWFWVELKYSPLWWLLDICYCSSTYINNKTWCYLLSKKKEKMSPFQNYPTLMPSSDSILSFCCKVLFPATTLLQGALSCNSLCNSPVARSFTRQQPCCKVLLQGPWSPTVFRAAKRRWRLFPLLFLSNKTSIVIPFQIATNHLSLWYSG